MPERAFRAATGEANKIRPRAEAIEISRPSFWLKADAFENGAYQIGALMFCRQPYPRAARRGIEMRRSLAH